MVIILLAVAVKYNGGSPPQSPPVSGNAETVAATLPELPRQVVQLELVSFYSGDAARRDILRLHNSQFPLADGIIGRYEHKASEMTVWVSVSATEEEAAELMDLMVTKMPASPVFQEKTTFEAEGMEIYHVIGMGMDHYYYLDGLYVYWLAVMDESPQAILKAFLAGH
jgi:hypothetical protein